MPANPMNPDDIKVGDKVRYKNHSPTTVFVVTGIEGRFLSKVFLSEVNGNRIMGSRNVALFERVTE